MNLEVAFRTAQGYFLTAVDGGGRTTNSIHSDAATIGPPDTNTGLIWQIFTLEDQGDGTIMIKTADGVHFLTAVGGGGRTTNTIHTDATGIGAPDPDGFQWEKFTLEFQEDGTYAIKTAKGFYLTAVDGGGISSTTKDALHTNATEIGSDPNGVSWELFDIVPLLIGPPPV